MYASIHTAFSMLPLQTFVPSKRIDKLDLLVGQLLKGPSKPGQQTLWQIQKRWLKDSNRGQLE